MEGRDEWHRSYSLMLKRERCFLLMLQREQGIMLVTKEW